MSIPHWKLTNDNRERPEVTAWLQTGRRWLPNCILITECIASSIIFSVNVDAKIHLLRKHCFSTVFSSFYSFFNRLTKSDVRIISIMESIFSSFYLFNIYTRKPKVFLSLTNLSGHARFSASNMAPVGRYIFLLACKLTHYNILCQKGLIWNRDTSLLKPEIISGYVDKTDDCSITASDLHAQRHPER